MKAWSAHFEGETLSAASTKYIEPLMLGVSVVLFFCLFMELFGTPFRKGGKGGFDKGLRDAEIQ